MISIGQIMAEILCAKNLEESDTLIIDDMIICWNKISFGGRTTIINNIKNYLESEDVKTEK